MSHLQQSIIEMYPNKIELLLKKFSNNQNEITKSLPLRELTLKLNRPTVTVEDIYAKFVNNIS
jgi:CRISPR/Cas system CSM-associated protein Csm4 (group 5 of RAMP superfamily)